VRDSCRVHMPVLLKCFATLSKVAFFFLARAIRGSVLPVQLLGLL